MYLLRATTGRTDTVQLFEHVADGIEAARKHVGDHNPVDGCSSERVELDKNRVFRCSRSTSWGLRTASVTPISFLEPTEL